ncbi:Ig-like domain-containing protein [Streptomyces sp. f51]|uniref:L,D-transpeptidase n=2 Tax=Streptomyces sp. f51 TaxID=1827742 RepID=UPI0030CFD0D5
MITVRKRRTGLMATAGALALTALGGTSYAATNGTGTHPGAQGQTQSQTPTQTPAQTPTQSATPRSGAQDASDARIRITPGQEVHGVALNDAVHVTVSNGRLTKVTMTAVATGTEIPGTLSADGTTWKPNGPLKEATSYSVTAEAEDAQGRSATEGASISTVSPVNDFLGHLSPGNGSTVGVGMPVSFTFDRTVHDKAAVASQIQVSSSSGQQVVGHWLNGSRLDFRPEHYWKPGSTVTVKMTVNGVQKTATFKVGRSQVSTVDAKTKQLTVVRDGKTIKTIPISSGSAEHPTYNGQLVIEEKFTHVHMNGATVGLTEKDGKPSYDIKAVPHAMRLTDSGTFIHGNYWGAPSVFGKVNTSHGCVGLKDARNADDPRTPAAWFFNHSMTGDVVIVKNSADKTKVSPDNGLSDWNMSWNQWVSGSSTSH